MRRFSSSAVKAWPVGCGLPFPLNASSVSVPGTERLTSKRACDRRHDVVIWLSVLRPRPHLQAAPLRDLGHLEVTRAARDRIQLAKRLAGLIPGGERFPGARFPLHTQLHGTSHLTPKAH